MEELLDKIITRQDLTDAEAEGAMSKIISGELDTETIKRFLLALREKGESVGEISAFARVLRSAATRVDLPEATLKKLVDTCGSGGDLKGSFNISTTAAFIVAGAGVPVAKHGNRSVSSKSGSADVLESLGVKIDLGPLGVERCLEEAGIGFMFAPGFHGAMKHAAEARREVGRTVFNILGPLISPAGVRHQVYGIYDPGLTEKLAHVLKELGSEHALVVHGMDGLDEMSTLGKTKVSELRNGLVETYFIEPGDFGLPIAALEDLKGGSPKENAHILMAILEGEKDPKRDIAVFNAGAAIYASDSAKTLKAGIEMAESSIESDGALDRLHKLIEVSNA
jgi:anthranilate phosphoribosyltransferase